MPCIFNISNALFAKQQALACTADMHTLLLFYAYNIHAHIEVHIHIIYTQAVQLDSDITT